MDFFGLSESNWATICGYCSGCGRYKDEGMEFTAPRNLECSRKRKATQDSFLQSPAQNAFVAEMEQLTQPEAFWAGFLEKKIQEKSSN